MIDKKIFILLGTIIIALAIIIGSFFVISQKKHVNNDIEIGLKDVWAGDHHILITPKGYVKVTKGFPGGLYLWDPEPFIDEESPSYEYETTLSEADTKELFELAERVCEKNKEKQLYSRGTGDAYIHILIKYKNYKIMRYCTLDSGEYPLLEEFIAKVSEKTRYEEVETIGKFKLPKRLRKTE